MSATHREAPDLIRGEADGQNKDGVSSTAHPTDPSAHPGEGRDLPQTAEQIEKGMQAMSEKYVEMGSELYLEKKD